MPLNTFPAKEMQFAVGPNRLDHVIGDPVATLATSYCRLFSHISCLDYEPSLTDIQDASVRQLAVNDAGGTCERMSFRLSFPKNMNHRNAPRL